jgi:hypothetical protein
MAYTGSCLCGGITFRVETELEPIQVCHCAQCRKAQGGPFAAVIPVAASTFKLLSGEHLLKFYESSPGKQRVFCGCCGSPIYSRRQALPAVVRVRAGRSTSRFLSSLRGTPTRVPGATGGPSKMACLSIRKAMYRPLRPKPSIASLERRTPWDS